MTDTRESESPSLFIPERSPQEWGIAFLLFISSALYLWPFRDFTLLFIDEGIILQGAQRILSGQVLYRDFFSFFTPGSYYLVAAVLKLSGGSFLAARSILLLYGGLLSVMTYLLARRACGRAVSILTAYLILTSGMSFRFMVIHNWDSLVLAYSALYCGVRFMEKPGRGWAFATGTLASMTCLFEQSKGVGLIIGLVLAAGLLFWAGAPFKSLNSLRPAAFAGGFAWPLALTVIYFGSQHALFEMMSDWFWPLFHYSGANRVAYGTVSLTPQNLAAMYASGPWLHRLFNLLVSGPFFILPALPFLTLVFMIRSAILLKNRSRSLIASPYCILVSSVSVGLALSVVLSSRPDSHHFVYVSPPLFLVLAWVLEGRVVDSLLLAPLRPLIAVGLLIVFTAFGLVQLVTGPVGARFKMETRRGNVRLGEVEEVIPYIQGQVKPGEKIFVYPYQPLYYFLSATYSPTESDYLQIGMHTRGQFDRTRDDLAKDRPGIIVWDPRFNTETVMNGWPATRPEDLAYDPVKDFILKNYRLCESLYSITGRCLIMVRHDLPCR